MKEIGVGIIGFGFMGKTHTFGYKTIPLYYENLPYKIRLVGVCNRTLEKAEYAKQMHGFEFATTNPDDIFNCPNIDVVNICTPNIYHKQAVLKALEAGKHVYCDKPLASSLEESNEIIELMKNYNLTTQMALQYRFFPVSMRAKELIEEGALGNILSFRSGFFHSGSIDPGKPMGWKQDKAFGGGGVMLDMGSHVLDLMYYLLGEYESIFADTTILYNERPDKTGKMVKVEGDDMTLMIAEMKNGGKGTIEASKIATGTNDEMRVEIHGDKGAIRFNLMEPNYLEYYDDTIDEEHYGGNKGFVKIECVQRFKKPGGGFPSPKFSIGWIRSHVHSLFNFLDCVDKKIKAKPSFEDGAYVQYVMEKAYESAEDKKWIKLD
jgi:predicted dehydrogenase